jgi:hypothetical protein
MNKWKTLLASLAIAGASGAAIASETPEATETSYESTAAASERKQTAGETVGYEAKAGAVEDGAS